MFATQVFKGVRVLELAQFVFVPAAGAILADLGADVIKIEMPEGDPYRRLKITDGRQTKSANLAMELNNRGKRSIAIDLKSDEGRALFLKLVETADVFLTSIRPAALKRLGLTLDVLRARNPRLIYAHGNGLGFRGEQADRAGYDASCFWARGGFAHMLSTPGQRPTRPRPALGDHAGAMNVAFGMASALFHRERTGEPSEVEISLLSSAMWILSADVTMGAALSDEQLAKLANPGRHALTSAYETADGRYLQLMFLDPERYWGELCRRTGCEALLDDPRFASVERRVEHGDALLAALDAAFASRTLDQWREAFAGWDAPWEVIQNLRELVTDPQASANDVLFDVTVEDGTPVTVVSGPVSFGGSPLPPEPKCAPGMGRDTAELLRELGLSDEAIADCAGRGVVTGVS
ncbi:CaiB/BaiF CoA transferase family protein [Novosphingobium mangrovi (ex Huang et al. 2023)]|uniref:CoA transferase n=1 Tax=Novosphingobium mangrovi (ex Huang et al. 2023) TaxID=2976432 RepID=A0ABT2I5W4_9SPHN|nr:CoA transferase [Novosphingobium mangrovi (ex Huang et al. 2023)]MCT2400196.1 CoA transferase [Novosphingobium mangrovi (ex Huang et al. 2023)]